MKQRRRIYYTDGQKALMWERWKKGESLQQIAQLFDREHSSIQHILAETGGIRPAVRRRSRLALTLPEREEISRSVVAGHSIRSIAVTLGRAPSTISREIKRNGDHGCYRATQADQAAWDRALRPKTCKLAQNRALARFVASKLQCQWAPQQIAGWLKHTYPCDEDSRVSHETIYRSLFIQARGALNKELLQHLRRTRAMRRSRHHTQKTDNHGRITDTVSIRERPASVEDRAVPGHWEGDLVFGSHNSQIATLVERQTRYVMLVKVASKDTETVINALIKHAQKLPQEIYKSLTWDRGKEMADHKRFTLTTDISVYFCDPQSPWQRGSNENTNGLLRQYFPRCPAGQSLGYSHSTIEDGMNIHVYIASSCKTCPQKSQCTTGKERRVRRWEHESVLDTMQTRIDNNRDKMKLRRCTVEHVFGTVKSWMGSVHFTMKGLAHVGTEISLHILAYNMRRVMTILGIADMIKAIRLVGA